MTTVPTATNFKGEKVPINCQCQTGEGSFSFERCSRKAKLGFRGKWYCTQHFKKAIESADRAYRYDVESSVATELDGYRDEDNRLREQAYERREQLLSTDPVMVEIGVKRVQLVRDRSEMMNKAYNANPVPPDLVEARELLRRLGEEKG